MPKSYHFWATESSMLLPKLGHYLEVYSLDEIASEKVVALTDRARNEPRDLYDTWYLVAGGHVNLVGLVEAIEQKWAFRSRALADFREEFRAKEIRYRRPWKPHLAAQMARSRSSCRSTGPCSARPEQPRRGAWPRSCRGNCLRGRSTTAIIQSSIASGARS